MVGDVFFRLEARFEQLILERARIFNLQEALSKQHDELKDREATVANREAAAAQRDSGLEERQSQLEEQERLLIGRGWQAYPHRTNA